MEIIIQFYVKNNASFDYCYCSSIVIRVVLRTTLTNTEC